MYLIISDRHPLSPLLSLSPSLLQIFLRNNSQSLMLPICVCLWGYPPVQENLAVATPQRKATLLLVSSHQLPIAPQLEVGPHTVFKGAVTFA